MDNNLKEENYSIFELYQDSILVVDENGTIKYINRYAENFFDTTLKRILKKNLKLLDLFKIEEDGFHLKYCVGILKEVPFSSKCGKTGRFQVNAQPDPFYDGGTIVYIHDVSLEANLQEKYQQESLNAEKFRIKAMVDELTGIWNYRAFMQRLQSICSEISNINLEQSLVVAMVDADHFKKVNDTYGHLQGDKVLKQIASILKQTVDNRGVVARYGGEEFIIVYPHIEEDYFNNALEVMRKNIENTSIDNIEGGPAINITVSIGATMIKAKHFLPLKNQYSIEDIIQKLIKMTDIKLYEAKEEGRNCVRPHIFKGQ